MIFLHGANSAGVELQPWVDAMRPYAIVRTPDMLGHGGRPVPASIDMRSVAEDVVAWMDQEGIDRAVMGGYSLGGSVALYVARHYPQRVSGVVALAAKHAFDATAMAHWKHLIRLERLEKLHFPWGKRTDELTRVHAPNDWRAVAELNSRFFDSLAREPPLPEAELRAIQAPVIVVSSDMDQVVPWAETLALGRALPNAHVAMFYGPSHPLRTVPLAGVARTVAQWMEKNALAA